jgi:hypothetical protein
MCARMPAKRSEPACPWFWIVRSYYFDRFWLVQILMFECFLLSKFHPVS